MRGRSRHCGQAPRRTMPWASSRPAARERPARGERSRRPPVPGLGGSWPWDSSPGKAPRRLSALGPDGSWHWASAASGSRLRRPAPAPAAVLAPALALAYCSSRASAGLSGSLLWASAARGPGPRLLLAPGPGPGPGRTFRLLGAAQRLPGVLVLLAGPARNLTAGHRTQLAGPEAAGSLYRDVFQLPLKDTKRTKQKRKRRIAI